MQNSKSAQPDKPLLDVKGLGVAFAHRDEETAITHNISFAIAPGERVGMVGESGCGKSVTGLALMGLLPRRTARIRGAVSFQGRNLLQMSRGQLRQVRGKEISMIFQEPMSALDPVFTVGQQLVETLRSHEDLGYKEARERSVAALEEVGIPSPGLRIDEYPYQFSGGMRQRVMIAMALICRPQLVIADEPTTALDVTVQAQITDLLCQLSDTTGTALLLITHDLGVVAETCSRLLTMYAGEIVETAPMDEVLYRPAHPYTSGLLQSLPSVSVRGAKLPFIPGRVPSPAHMPAGCRFQDRCPYATQGCELPQALETFDTDREVRCWRAHELTLPGAVDQATAETAAA